MCCKVNLLVVGGRARFSNVSRYGLVKIVGLEWYINVLYSPVGLYCHMFNEGISMDRGIKCQYI